MAAQDVKWLLDRIKSVTITKESREKQRRSFAYGNTKIENNRITRETVNRAAERLNGTKP